jgi:hypothetical protein
MDLVSLETPEENICVLDKVQSGSSNVRSTMRQFYTSLTMEPGQNNFTAWKSGETLSYAGWGTGFPQKNGRCMILQ